MSEDQSNSPQPQMLEYIEQYRCPKCDSAIAREFVRAHLIDARDWQTPRREVTVLCEACGQVSQAKFVLSANQWALDGAVRAVGGMARKAFLRRMGRACGDRQLSP